jgi:hypothetical protein
VLLDIGSLPLLAELDQLLTTGVRLPENPTLLTWSQQLRLPLGLAMLNKWQLDTSFAELLPLQLTAETPSAARMLILAHDYYLQRQSSPNQPQLSEVQTGQALHVLPEGEEFQMLSEWLEQKK